MHNTAKRTNGSNKTDTNASSSCAATIQVQHIKHNYMLYMFPTECHAVELFALVFVERLRCSFGIWPNASVCSCRSTFLCSRFSSLRTLITDSWYSCNIRLVPFFAEPPPMVWRWRRWPLLSLLLMLELLARLAIFGAGAAVASLARRIGCLRCDCTRLSDTPDDSSSSVRPFVHVVRLSVCERKPLMPSALPSFGVKRTCCCCWCICDWYGNEDFRCTMEDAPDDDGGRSSICGAVVE